ncbi:MAG: ATP-dependent RecD-like DNA helicase [Ruminococcaceae bacterium]|nr:ATP-dependent RecD-like DNA helicase [Oscillospiraceae bacterium]
MADYQQDQQILSGSVAAVVFHNPENGYAVVRLWCDSGELVNVVGTIPMPAAGERLIVTGRWGRHASYGQQFQAEFLERLLPESKRDIQAYLATRVIRGIGERTAEKIVERFGTDSLKVIESEPERLTAIPGISLRKAKDISEQFRMQLGLRRLMEFLTSYHLPPELGPRLYRYFGEQAVEVVQNNPYLLAEPEYGAAFTYVDAFALELGFEEDDPRRAEAGILYELLHNLNNGHVFLPTDKLITATASLLNLQQEIIEPAVQRLTEQGKLMADTVANLQVCYLPEYHEAECYVTDRLLQMADTRYDAPRNLERTIDRIAEENGIEYAEKQVEAITAAATCQLMVLTGGPGTGKTTTLAGMLCLFDRLGLKTQLAAPTGRAAKRLSELTGREAATIHRLLQTQFSEDSAEMVFFHDEDEPLKADVLVVDETSMVDLLLMQSLLRAMKPKCRLVLVGDPDQLPSVGAGNVFSDIIRSGCVHTVRLTEIFRQAQESLIVMNAHAVNHGELPELGVKDRDFFFLRRKNQQDVQQTILELASRRLPQNMGIPSSEIQILSPTRKGETGTVRLNSLLQTVLNPQSNEKKERSYGEFLFREGDRVMQIRNNYDILWKKADGTSTGSGIFNGDVGQVLQIDFSAETVRIQFDDKIAEYGFDMLMELEPAYAMTVHKSQGSEYRAVILCVTPGSPLLHTRGILYTAITRAKQLLILVGDEQVVAEMVHNDRKSRRYSGLKLRLEKGRAE